MKMFVNNYIDPKGFIRYLSKTRLKMWQYDLAFIFMNVWKIFGILSLLNIPNFPF